MQHAMQLFLFTYYDRQTEYINKTTYSLKNLYVACSLDCEYVQYDKLLYNEQFVLFKQTINGNT